MPTPDFEEWLARQDIPLEETTTQEKWRQYMIDEFGLKDGTLDVAEDVRARRYDILPDIGIRPIERHYTYMGEPFVETRYVITEAPGLWGVTRAYQFAEERWIARGEPEKAETARTYLEKIEKYPEKYKARWAERRT